MGTGGRRRRGHVVGLWPPLTVLSLLCTPSAPPGAPHPLCKGCSVWARRPPGARGQPVGTPGGHNGGHTHTHPRCAPLHPLHPPPSSFLLLLLSALKQQPALAALLSTSALHFQIFRATSWLPGAGAGCSMPPLISPPLRPPSSPQGAAGAERDAGGAARGEVSLHLDAATPRRGGSAASPPPPVPLGLFNPAGPRRARKRRERDEGRLAKRSHVCQALLGHPQGGARGDAPVLPG